MMKTKTILDYIHLETNSKDPSHLRLCSEAGICMIISSGLYAYLPLGLALKDNVEAVCKHEMLKIGCEEVLLPALLPKQLLDISGRNKQFDAIYQTEDLYLAPTHEESITVVAQKLLHSYKDLLPKGHVHLLQISPKMRREARAKGGMLRTKEFEMQDSYTFSLDDGKDIYYNTRKSYQRIFDTLQLPHVIVEADASSMKGNYSEEVHYLSEWGEDTIAISDKGYAANLEVAGVYNDSPSYVDYQSFYVLNKDKKAIELRVPIEREINAYKVQTLMGTDSPLLHEYEGAICDVIFDINLESSGDTKKLDLTYVKTGDLARDEGHYKLHKSIEIGHLFNLGDYYSRKFDFSIHDHNNNRKYVNMGCYGIGISRLLSVLLMEHGKNNYIKWPDSIRPIKNIVIVPHKQEEDYDLAYKIQQELLTRDQDVAVYQSKLPYTKAINLLRTKGCPCIVVVSNYSKQAKVYKLGSRYPVVYKLDNENKELLVKLSE